MIFFFIWDAKLVKSNRNQNLQLKNSTILRNFNPFHDKKNGRFHNFIIFVKNKSKKSMKNVRNLAILFVMVCTSASLFAQDDLAGAYKMQENPYVKVVKIAVKEGKVILIAEGYPDTELGKGKVADEYILESMNATITFAREAGKVKGLKLDAQGQTLSGEKEGASGVSTLNDYVASFKMDDNEYVKKMMINVKDGKLMISSDANPTEAAVLKEAKDADVFTTSIQGYDADIMFTRNGGKISAIKLSVAGGQVVLTGKRE